LCCTQKARCQGKELSQLNNTPEQFQETHERGLTQACRVEESGDFGRRKVEENTFNTAPLSGEKSRRERA